MPGAMDGMKLAAAIRDRWPPIEIILTLGYKALTLRIYRRAACSSPSLRRREGPAGHQALRRRGLTDAPMVRRTPQVSRCIGWAGEVTAMLP